MVFEGFFFLKEKKKAVDEILIGRMQFSAFKDELVEVISNVPIRSQVDAIKLWEKV